MVEGRGSSSPSLFKRIVLPGLAFKAIVIGGGYATGRELAEYFVPSGPWGGMAAMVLTAGIWSLICVVTFLFARAINAREYRTFFRSLLGPFWIAFEIVYILAAILILAVFGAAAGAIGAALFGWPKLFGTVCLIAGIGVATAFGNTSVERLFKWASFVIYATYVVFLALALNKFGGRIAASFAAAPGLGRGWISGGMDYAGYNVLGAAAILAVVRQMTSSRDAITAGLLAGPLAIIPGVLLFICMCAYYPQIGSQVLPSDFLLRKLGLPVFRFVFQLMIFVALLESGTGLIHALNERIAEARRATRGWGLQKGARFALSTGLLVLSIFVASRVGLVALIAKGYRALAYSVMIIYLLPLMTYGIWILRHQTVTRRRSPLPQTLETESSGAERRS